MARLIFSGGASVSVQGSKEQWKGHLSTDDQSTPESRWLEVQTTDGRGAVVNAGHIAYILDGEEPVQKSYFENTEGV